MDQWAKDLWEKNKIVFFLLIPVILLIYFRSFFINLLLSDSRKIATEADQKDNQLSKEETQANSQSNQIIADANKLSDNKPPVTEDWNKNAN